jgi:phage terminase large subunit-like protein
MTDPMALLASLRLQDGSTWGSRATPLQVADARAVLLPVAGDPRRHWLSRSKGYSKTTDIAAMSLVALLTQLPPGAEAYAAANDGDQAGLLLRAMRGFVTRTPGLEGEVKIEARRVLAPNRGTELVVLPADSAGSNGLSPSWLVIDEVCNWSEDDRHRSFFESLLAGAAKVATGRVIIMSTAGSPGHAAEKFFVQAGHDDKWRLSHVEGPSPWLSPADIELQRRTLMPGTFARWFENRWVSGGDDRLANWDQIKRAAVLDGPQPRVIGNKYYMGVDLGLAHDRTAVAVVHSELAGEGAVQNRRFFVDHLVVRSGRSDEHVDLDSIEQVILSLHAHYDRPEIRFDPWQAEMMIGRLKKRGVNVETRSYSAQLFDQMATKMAELFREDLIAIPSDAALMDELASVKIVEKTPGRYRIDTRTKQQHDDRAIACGYAITLAVDRAGMSARRPLAAVERELERQRNALCWAQSRSMTADNMTRVF